MLNQSYILFFSFTIEGWINLPTGFPSTKLPYVCTYNSSQFCVYIEDSKLYTQVGSRIVAGTTAIVADTWTHIASVYNAQGK